MLRARIIILTICLLGLSACLLPAQVDVPSAPAQPLVVAAATQTAAPEPPADPTRPAPDVTATEAPAPAPSPTSAPTVPVTPTLTSTPTSTSMSTSTPTLAPTETTAPTATPTQAITTTASAADWYRYQGAPESGDCATANCGPAVVAMAIGYATGERVTIADIRTFTSGDSCRGTDYTDAERALQHYKIDFQAVEGMDALQEAVNQRQHPVLVILYMDFITPGQDYLQPQTAPEQHFGRYHGYTSGHFVVVTGVTADGKWVIVRDPYVFDPELAFYKDGVPKGKDRYYSYDEFKQAYRYYGYYGLEILPAKS